ncbi:MAG: DUF2974 domain-containing protein [Treponema sp.]|nr:DUF2974 domain-containing protein [Treponema sp.]
MADLTDYLSWRGDLSFSASPFCHVDALVLTALSYLNLKDCVPVTMDQGTTLKEVCEKFHASPDFEARRHLGAVLNERTVDLLELCGKSVRFENIKVCGYQDILDTEKCMQFAAMVFELESNLHMVTYRGTDDTLLGWHEDFNLGFMDPIPSQAEGVEYFKKVASAFKGDFIVSGHSKGANVALYTGTVCEKSLQNRIKNVYNFDGPNLPKHLLESSEFKALKNRILSFYPEMCMIGAIFHHMEDCTIVKSSEFAIMQHDYLSWQILGANFETADKVKPESEIFENSVNQWIEGLTKEEIKEFAGNLFSMVDASGAKTNTDLEENKFLYSTRLIAEFTRMDTADRKKFFSILNELKHKVKGNLPIFNIFSLPELI